MRGTSITHIVGFQRSSGDWTLLVLHNLGNERNTFSFIHSPLPSSQLRAHWLNNGLSEDWWRALHISCPERNTRGMALPVRLDSRTDSQSSFPSCLCLSGCVCVCVCLCLGWGEATDNGQQFKTVHSSQQPQAAADQKWVDGDWRSDKYRRKMTGGNTFHTAAD